MKIMSKLGYSFVLILGYVITLCEGDFCWYDTNYIDCGYNSCCGSDRNLYCCTAPETIIGAVLGSVIFIVIVVAIVACRFCACCPGYRYRHNQGTVIITARPGPSYQTIPNAPYLGNTGPYPPQNTGPYPPQNTGPYPPQNTGPYPPQNTGPYPLQNTGPYPPQNTGPYPPQNTGPYPPQNTGPYPPQNTGPYPPQNTGPYPLQNTGPYPPQNTSIYSKASRWLHLPSTTLSSVIAVIDSRNYILVSVMRSDIKEKCNTIQQLVS